MGPTPRELRVLVACADGCSLQVAAARLGEPWDDQRVSCVLTHLYRRLKIQDRGYWGRKERRQLAVRICKANGWWPQGEGS
jgi:DNA-binding NarL/FixJ family response regulator